jgi:ABC-type sugar transport system substrate-binding protein
MPTIVLLVPNLLFGASITQTVQAAGAQVRPCRSLAQFEAALAAGVPLLAAVVDLGSQNAWEPAIRAAAGAGLPVFAFGPHIESTTLKGARQAGATRVVANSALAQEFPKWLAGMGVAREA